MLLDLLAEKLPNKYGDIYTEAQYRNAYDKFRCDTEIGASIYQFRHSYATLLFEASIDSKDAQDLLGHTNKATTDDTYTHIRQARKEQTISKLNTFVNNQ